MQSPQTNTPPDNEPGKTRLDRELEEILSRNENVRLLPPTPKPSRRKPAPHTPTPGLEARIPPRIRKLLGAPIILALVLAVVALMVSDASPLLANLLSLAAVGCIIVPMIQRFRRPAAAPEIRMWRGQTFDVQPHSQTPLDGLRAWWKSHRP